MQTLKILIINIALLLIILPAVNAQSTGEKQEQITVVAPYEPEIPQAFKISVSPQVDDTAQTKPAITYSFNIPSFIAKPALVDLPSVKITGETLEELSRFYIKGGIGNYSAFYGEAFLSSLRSKTLHYSIRAKHNSMAGKLQSLAPPKVAVSEIEANGNFFLKTHVLSANIKGQNNKIRLYGFDPKTYKDTVEKKDIENVYNIVSTRIELKSDYQNQYMWNHKVGFSGNFISGNRDNSENNYIFDFNVHKKHSLLNLYEDETYGIEGFYNHFAIKSSQKNNTLSIFDLKPFIVVPFQNLTVKAGLKFELTYDTVAKTEPHLYPDISADFVVIPQTLKLYLNATGGIITNNLKDIFQENMYMSSVFERKFTNEKINIGLGLNSKVAPNASLNAGISYHIYKDYAFFNTDPNAEWLNSFILQYYDANLLKLHGDFTITESEKWFAQLNMNYNIWKPKNIVHAWYKPQVVLNLKSQYNVQNKIIAKAGLTFESSRWSQAHLITDARYVVDNTILKEMIDVSLGLEYRFNHNISAWINADNLLNQKTFIFDKYRRYGINFMCGASISL